MWKICNQGIWLKNQHTVMKKSAFIYMEGPLISSGNPINGYPKVNHTPFFFQFYHWRNAGSETMNDR